MPYAIDTYDMNEKKLKVIRTFWYKSKDEIQSKDVIKKILAAEGYNKVQVGNPSFYKNKPSNPPSVWDIAEDAANMTCDD